MMKLALLLLLVSCAIGKKTVIAHRGAPAYLPEHTLEGVAMAHAWGVDYIEPDVVLSKDLVPMVLHDIHIDTTTNVKDIYPKRKRKDGRYYAIDFTKKELKKLTVHERINLKTNERVFPKRFMRMGIDFKIPTLEEFIQVVQELNRTRGKNIGIYPEIKSPEFHLKHKKDITKVVFNLLDGYGYNKEDAKIYVQCFYPPTLKRLRDEFKAKMPLVALIAENSWKESSIDYDYYQTKKGIKELSSYVNGIGPYLLQLFTLEETKSGKTKVKKTKIVEWAHENGLVVHPFTHRSDQMGSIKDDKTYFQFIYRLLEVDGIFSDFGDAALKYSR